MRLLSFTLSLVAASSVVSFGDNAPVTGCDRVDSLSAAINARSPSEVADAYSALFDNASVQTVRRLKAHTHQAIALRAAWQEVRRMFPAETEYEEGVWSKSHEIDVGALQRFLGFVEGRLGISLPGWWEEMFLDTEAIDRETLSLPFSESYSYHPTEVDLPWARGIQLVASPGIQISNADGEDLVVTRRRLTFQLPGRLLHEAKRTVPVSHVTGYMDKARCVVAFHSDRPAMYPVWCFDRRTANVLWSTKVWGERTLVPGGGGRIHLVDIDVYQGKVYIFGASNFSMYIEAFSLMNGENVFRFSTSY